MIFLQSDRLTVSAFDNVPVIGEIILVTPISYAAEGRIFII